MADEDARSEHTWSVQAADYLLSIAWSDGAIHPSERAFIQRVLEAMGEQGGVSEEQLQARRAWLDEPPPPLDWSAILEDEAESMEALRQAIALAMIDRTVSVPESHLLDDLRERLGMEEREYVALQQRIERVIAPHIMSARKES